MELLDAVIGRDNHDITWWQMSIRAALILAVGLALVRGSGKRAFSREAPLDIVITIVLGSNLSRALTGNAPFLPVIVSSAVMVALYRALSQMTRRGGMAERWIKGNPITLIRDGEVEASGLHRSSMSREDLIEALRAKGVDDPARVHLATLERGGQISVLQKT
jgi:uncharacterized membrane protein YcaP (DUF421 family)